MRLHLGGGAYSDTLTVKGPAPPLSEHNCTAVDSRKSHNIAEYFRHFILKSKNHNLKLEKEIVWKSVELVPQNLFPPVNLSFLKMDERK